MILHNNLRGIISSKDKNTSTKVSSGNTGQPQRLQMWLHLCYHFYWWFSPYVIKGDVLHFFINLLSHVTYSLTVISRKTPTTSADTRRLDGSNFVCFHVTVVTDYLSILFQLLYAIIYYMSVLTYLITYPVLNMYCNLYC